MAVLLDIVFYFYNLGVCRNIVSWADMDVCPD